MIYLITDSIAVDTTNIGYRIGFELASWFPFLIIVFLFILVIRKRYKVRD